MFVTDDEELLKRAQTLWSFGETRTPVESRDYHVYGRVPMHSLSTMRWGNTR
jgi:hypothetical protein